MTNTVVTTSRSTGREQPWLSSAGWDSVLIISPAFISSLIVLLIIGPADQSQSLPVWAWVSFVLLVDVSHVYSTLFRTYLNRKAMQNHKTLLVTVPLICWAVGAVLYSIDGLVFWRTLAYLAVFHFIRQQFGFMTLYSRKDPEQFRKFRWLDCSLIYLAAIYPLVYWHTHMPRNFNWFIAGDFLELSSDLMSTICLGLYATIALGYIVKETLLSRSTGFFNLPKNLIISGTAVSWWVGIVALNSDMAFTITNVLTHGIPYMALIWLYHGSLSGKGRQDEADSTNGSDNENQSRESGANLATRLALSYVPAFILFLAVLAYLEEGFWDGFVWREHLAFFAPFAHLPEIIDPVLLALLIPLLSLPQATHYVLDGFIWRVKDRKSVWSA